MRILTYDYLSLQRNITVGIKDIIYACTHNLNENDRVYKCNTFSGVRTHYITMDGILVVRKTQYNVYA